jgi:DNA-binding winged helix-turn-helix (wHTH) protein
MERPSLTFGPFRLNDANGTLLRDGEPLPVGQRAVRILHALLQRRGEVLTKAELMDAGWPDATVEEANLHVQIASLRKVLGSTPDGGEWIVTIPRIGYRFVPEPASGDEVMAKAGEAFPVIQAEPGDNVYRHLRVAQQHRQEAQSDRPPAQFRVHAAASARPGGI